MFQHNEDASAEALAQYTQFTNEKSGESPLFSELADILESEE